MHQINFASIHWTHLNIKRCFLFQLFLDMPLLECIENNETLFNGNHWYYSTRTRERDKLKKEELQLKLRTVYTYTFIMSTSQRTRTFNAVRSAFENVWRHSCFSFKRLSLKEHCYSCVQMTFALKGVTFSTQLEFRI